MLRIARVDEDGMQLCAVGRSILIAAAPCLALRMLVEAIDAFPSRAAIGRAEQPLGGSTRVPRGLFGRVTRRQPERVIDDAAAAFGECGWLRGFLPCLAGVAGAKDGWAEVAGSRCRGQRPCIAGSADRMMDDVTTKQRARELH